MSDEIEDLRTEKDRAYWERNQLVAALSKIYPAWLSRHQEEDTDWEDDWRWIVFIEIPTKELEMSGFDVKHKRQLSWHIHDTHFQYFSHLSVKPNTWDGHTTDEKYRRLSRIVKR
jgi:hypothetical protein